MKRMNGWWTAAVAGLAALAIPAGFSLAQASDETDAIEAFADEFSWWDDVEALEAFVGHGSGHGPGMRRGGAPGAGPGGARGMRHGRRGADHGPHGRGLGMMLRALDLSDDQKKRVADIHDREMRKAIQARADLRIARLDLHKLMRADSPDRRAIEVQIDKVGGMRAALEKAHVRAMLEVRGLLTDEQKKKLRELHEAGPGMHGRGGPGMGGGRMRERIHHPDAPEDAR